MFIENCTLSSHGAIIVKFYFIKWGGRLVVPWNWRLSRATGKNCDIYSKNEGPKKKWLEYT